MRLTQSYQDMISENLALQNVPGHKQAFPLFSTDTKNADPAHPLTSLNSSARVTMTKLIDFSQGQLEPSGSPFHLAIQGQSFFKVAEANGTQSFTRNGEFNISSQGQLVTTDGATVLSEGGSPITIDATQAASASTAEVGKDGSITLGGVVIGKVGLAHFANPTQSLQPGEYGRFTVSDPTSKQDGIAPGDKVLQGQLEQGNGNPVEQMADMIQAMRLYEANQKVVQAGDDNQSQLITTLGSK